MADPSIDPRLYASALPPRSQSQSYTATSEHGTAHPYYLPTPDQVQPPQPAQAAVLSGALDPVLANEPSHDDEDEHEDDGDHDGTHATPGSAKSPGDLKRPRACDSCRGLKVRCDQERPDVSCKRCAKANRPCITTPPTRKRQKKADSRVAELERKIDALTATLHAQKSAGPEIQHHGGIPQHEGNTPATAMPEGSYRMGTVSHEWSSPGATGAFPNIPPGYGPAQNIQQHQQSGAKRRRLDGNGHASIPEDMDAIHRDLTEHAELRSHGKSRQLNDHSHLIPLIDSLMGPEVAERVFLRYIHEICPHFPAVPFPPGTTAKEVREKKPLLFLAIVAGSSHGHAEQLVSPDVQRELTKLLKDQLADSIWRNGEKSLEIVQALHVAVLWYRPPLHFEQHNFYMMVNCAAVMALDLGLGKKATPNVMKLSIGPFRRYHPNSSSIEARRTFLVCYYLCMSITMILRRPILLHWTKYMEESMKLLETSPEALASDKLLCQHIKLARIGENISTQFCMDDPSADVSISEPKVIYALKIFENELLGLRDENSKTGDVDPTLQLGEHVTNLYLHEIALHQNQTIEDWHPPFLNNTEVQPGLKKDVPVGPAHISALGECLTATHGILDTILRVQIDVLLTLPVIFCVRAIYASVCLMKMWVSVTNSGEVSNIIKKDDLKIETYLEQLVTMFNAIVTRDTQSPHGKFYFVAKRLQDRFAMIKEGASKNEQNGSDLESKQQSDESHRRSSRQSSSQTPLHLLSEVAMGSSNSASTQRPCPAHVQSQQQAQAALAQSQNAQQNWFSSVAQPTDSFGLPQTSFDLNFDFTQFDLGTGSDADLSALFIPEPMMWSYPSGDVMLGPPYTGFQA